GRVEGRLEQASFRFSFASEDSTGSAENAPELALDEPWWFNRKGATLCSKVVASASFRSQPSACHSFVWFLRRGNRRGPDLGAAEPGGPFHRHLDAEAAGGNEAGDHRVGRPRVPGLRTRLPVRAHGCESVQDPAGGI